MESVPFRVAYKNNILCIMWYFARATGVPLQAFSETWLKISNTNSRKRITNRLRLVLFVKKINILYVLRIDFDGESS